MKNTDLVNRQMNHEIQFEYKGYSNWPINERSPEVQALVDEFFAKGGKVKFCNGEDLKPLTPVFNRTYRRES